MKKRAIVETAAKIIGATATTTAVAASTGAAAPAAAAVAVTAGLLALSRKLNAMQIIKSTAPVETVSDTWKSRPKANMVKWLMKQSGVKLETIADYLGCSVSYLNTKLARDSFSFEDLILAAYACGYTFVLADNNGDGEVAYRIDLIRQFENSDPEVLKRIDAIEERAAKREEYEKQKAQVELEYAKKKEELERLKKEYGIED